MTAIDSRTYTADQIIAIGGQEWSPRPGMHRVYINNAAELAGLEIDTYRHGGISRAWLGGERIANTRAAEIRRALDKVWWDSKDGQIHARADEVRPTPELEAAVERLAAEIARRVDELTPADKDGDQGVDGGEAAEDVDAEAGAEVPGVDPVQRVAELRARCSVREIARLVGCAVSTVYRWLAGQCRPSARYAAVITALA